MMKLCLFGAGNTGKVLLEKNLNAIKGKYKEIFFIDRNRNLWDNELCGFKIKRKEFIDEDTEVIITSSNYWHEIYEFCFLNKIDIKGIYDICSDKIVTYKEMCKIKKNGYENDKFIDYYSNKTSRINQGIKNFLLNNNLFDNVSEYQIMLSNLCNYACMHTKCPAHLVKEKEILPSNIVFKIINELEKISFDGTISFHLYNEPLIDPRLFWFIDYVKKCLPNSKIEVYSNGYYLNDIMVKELESIGADILIVTGYGDAEYERLLDLKVDISYYVLYGNLDERLDNYKERSLPISNSKCGTYIRQVPIYSNGDLGTCCLDYLHSYSIGNVYNDSIKNILNSEKVINMQKELLKGNRSIFTICKNCNWIR